MAEIQLTAAKATSTAAGSSLVCRLTQRESGQDRGRPSPAAGQVELENRSGEVIEIELTMSPFQHLDLVVTDEEGNQLPARPYSDIFSPLAEPYVLRLQPGEKFVGNVALLANVLPERLKPGWYRVQAVYNCPKARAVSEPITVRFDGGPV